MDFPRSHATPLHLTLSIVLPLFLFLIPSPTPAAAASCVSFLHNGTTAWTSGTCEAITVADHCNCICQLEVKKSTLGDFGQGTTYVEHLVYQPFSREYGLTYTFAKSCVFEINPHSPALRCYQTSHTISALTVNPAHQYYIASAISTGSTIMQTARTGTSLIPTPASIHLEGVHVKWLDASPDGRYIGMALEEQGTSATTIRVWDVTANHVINAGPGTDMRFLPDRIAIQHREKTPRGIPVTSWSISSWPEMKPIDTLLTDRLAVSSDRSHLFNFNTFEVIDQRALGNTADYYTYPLRPLPSIAHLSSFQFSDDNGSAFCHFNYAEADADHSNMRERHIIMKYSWDTPNTDGEILYSAPLDSKQPSTCLMKNLKAMLVY